MNPNEPKDLTPNNDAKIAVIMTKIEFINDAIKEIKSILLDQSEKFVTKEEFAQVRNIVFGMVAIILASFIGGLVLLVWKT